MTPKDGIVFHRKIYTVQSCNISSINTIRTFYFQNLTLFSEAFGLAPFCNNNCPISVTPFSAAQCKGVHWI